MATILPENKTNQELNSYVHQFFCEDKLGTLLNQANVRKETGISPVFLLQFIFSLVLQRKICIGYWNPDGSQRLLQRMRFIACSTTQPIIGASFCCC